MFVGDVFCVLTAGLLFAAHLHFVKTWWKANNVF